MGIQSFTPSSGGGMPGASFIAAIQMTTYNRSWTQTGGPGDYVLVSSNLSNGYAYFISGGTTTGVPLGRIINLPSGFTRMDIVAPKDDYIMLYKVATKTTTEFVNPFSNFSSFPSLITSSGNFVLPNNALPLVNVLVVASGGSAFHHGGGGGGGGVVKLTAYQAVGTTSVTIGAGVNGNGSTNGNPTYFGNVYALGGGAAPGSSQGNGQDGGNGGGSCAHSSGTTFSGGAATVQTASTGLGNSGSPVQHGNRGGNSRMSDGNHTGGGGGGAGGAGPDRINIRGGHHGGAGHASDISGSTLFYGAGGANADHHSNQSSGNPPQDYAHTSGVSYGHGGNSRYNSHSGSAQGAVVVRYYIP